MDRRREEVSAAEALLLAECEDSLLSLRAASTPPLDSYAGLESLAEQALQEGGSSSSRLLPPPITTAVKVPPLLAEEVKSHPSPAGAGALSNGLDALATLASEERQGSHSTTTAHADAVLARHLRASGVASASSSEEEEDDVMPPPPSRRRRAASNPEGMEKWDSLGGGRHSSRRHFVLPESILEEELAEASAAVRERELQRSSSTEEAPEEEGEEEGGHVDDEMPGTEEEAASEVDGPDETKAEPEEEVDESMLTPDELLRKARSRLLEDLSEGSIHGEKGEVLLPHALGKYKQVGSRIVQNTMQASAHSGSEFSPMFLLSSRLLIPTGIQPEW
jgi:hypothetical protein